MTLGSMEGVVMEGVAMGGPCNCTCTCALRCDGRGDDARLRLLPGQAYADDECPAGADCRDGASCPGCRRCEGPPGPDDLDDEGGWTPPPWDVTP